MFDDFLRGDKASKRPFLEISSFAIYLYDFGSKFVHSMFCI